MSNATLIAPVADPGIRPDILSCGGRYVDLVNPESNVFAVEDIAHALANICRFTGHTRIFYSVAQHSVLVSQIVPPEDALAALFHDAAEAFLGDVSKPLKNLLPDYRALEARFERELFGQLGLPWPMPDSVKRADRILLATEKRDLMPPHADPCGSDEWALLHGVEPLAKRIVPAPPFAAHAIFMGRFDELTAEAQS